MKQLFLSLLLMWSTLTSGQGAYMEWVNHCVGCTIKDVSTTVEGDVLITGSFRGTVDFDPSQEVYELSTSVEEENIFIARYSSFGDLVWAKQIGNKYNSSSGLTIRGGGEDGAIYVAGYFLGYTDFNPHPQQNNYLSTNNGKYTFVLKLNEAGEYVWANALTGGSPFGWDASGVGNMDFAFTAGDKIYISNNIETADYNVDARIVKLNAASGVSWSRTIRGFSVDINTDVVVDSENSIYAIGYFSSDSLWMGNEQLGINRIGTTDAYILKIDGAGQLLWAKQLGTEGAHIKPTSISLDENENLYLTGDYKGVDVDFDPGSGEALHTSMDIDFFVLKLNSDGEYLWSDHYGGGLDDHASSIQLAGNQVLVSGTFKETVDFDNDASTYSLSAGDTPDHFLLKVDTDGSFLGAGAFNSSAAGSKNFAMSTSSQDHVFTTGLFYGDTDFDPTQNQATLNGANGSSFLHKMALEPCALSSKIIYVQNNSNHCPGEPISLSVELPGGLTNVSCQWNTGQTGLDIIVYPNITTEYVAQIYFTIDDTNCSISDTITLVKTVGSSEIPYNGIDDDCDDSTPDDDIDQDGFIALYDCDDYDPTFPANPGTICDDGNPKTLEDVILSDGCTCRGNYLGKGPNFEYFLAFEEGVSNNNIATDSFGNIILSGSFEGTIDVDPGPGVHELTATGDGRNQYVVKFNAAKELLWGFTLENESYWNSSENITTDQLGNIYMTGHFNQTLGDQLGPDVNFQYENAGLYVLKINPDGAVVWAKGFEKTEEDSNIYMFDIVVNDAGEVFICGTFKDDIDFDPSSETYIVNGGGWSWYQTSAYILKLDNQGNYDWVKIVDEERFQFKSLAFDEEGNLFLAGHFRGTDLDVDPGQGVHLLSSSHSYRYETFLMKVTEEADLVWVKKIGGDSAEVVLLTDLLVDKKGDLVLVGSFEGTVDFDPGPDESLLHYEYYYGSPYVLKLDKGGNFIWVTKPFYNEGHFYLGGIDIDGNNNIFLNGYFYGVVGFKVEDQHYFESSLSYQSYYGNANYENEAFLYMLNEAGQGNWVGTFRSELYNYDDRSSSRAHDLVIDKDNNIYSIGYQSGKTDVNPNWPVEKVENYDHSVSFLMKLGQTCQPAPIIVAENEHHVFCPGEESMLLTLETPADVLPYAYNWNTGATTSSILATPQDSSVHSIVVDYVRDSSNCHAYLEVELTQWDSTLLDYLLDEDLSICQFDNAVLSVNGGQSYNWSTGENTEEIAIEPLASQLYYVTITDQVDCEHTDSISVTVIPSPEVTIYGPDVLCEGDSSHLYIEENFQATWSTGETSDTILIHTSGPDTYLVTLTNSGGCTATSFWDLDFQSAPDPVLNLSDTIVDVSMGPLLLSVPSVVGASSYVWHLPEGVEILSDPQEASVLLYWEDGFGLEDEICVQAVNDCGASLASCFNLTVLGPSTLSTIEESFYRIYPNPAQDILYLSMEHVQNVEVLIIDLLGRVVLETEGMGDMQFDLNHLATGTYWFKLSTGDQVAWKAIQIQK